MQKLQGLRINRFLPDEPKPDLEALGLQPPDLEIALAQGTDTVARLQFGKNPTNDPQQIYGRRLDLNALVIVSNQWLAPWRVSGSANDFRDPNLVAPTQPVEAIEVHSQETFSIYLQTNDTWLIRPGNFPADRALMRDFLSALTNLQIVSFVKDLVADPDLPAYGLAPPARQFTLRGASSNSPAGLTNKVIAELSFGTNQQDKVFARRLDESSVYAVKLADFEHLPTAGWQLRDRQIWNSSETNVVRVSIRQRGKTRQMLHKGTYEWSLAPGSQGSLEPLRIEETVRGLCHLAASAWTARGATNRVQFGFADDGHQVTIELKDGQQLSVEFGREAPSSCQYGAIMRDGELFIFECPWLLYRDVLLYLSVPSSQ